MTSNRNKIGELARKLSLGVHSKDPFDDDFFDVAEYERRRQELEGAVIEEAMAAAKAKQALREKIKTDVKHQQPETRLRKDWQ
jgi:hypothetical protein